MSKKIFSITRVRPVLSIEHLTYGIGKINNKYSVFLKKRGKQWVRKNESYRTEIEAINAIYLIKDEYDAVRAKQEANSK